MSDSTPEPEPSVPPLQSSEDLLPRSAVQDEVNRLMAEKKRNLQKEAEANKQAYANLRQQVDSLLEGRPIDEFREELEKTANSLRTAEENAVIAQRKYEKDLKKAQEAAQINEKRYRDLAINRALTDAAIPVASGSDPTGSSELIAQILYGKAEVDENGVVTVKMEVEEEGVKQVKQLSPEDAVKQVESMTKYAALFKSGVAGGLGGSQEGLASAGATQDISKVDSKDILEAVRKQGLRDAIASFSSQ